MHEWEDFTEEEIVFDVDVYETIYDQTNYKKIPKMRNFSGSGLYVTMNKPLAETEMYWERNPLGIAISLN